MKGPFDDIRKELEEAGSFLSPATKKDLEIPAGYFEQLEKEILAKTISTENKKAKVVRMRWVRYAISVAAAAAVVFMGINFINDQKQSPEIQFAKMSDAELEAYLDKQIASLTADDLHNYIKNNINDIEAVLFAETELIDNESLNNQLNAEINLQILSDEDLNKETEEPLLDKELLDQIDDETIEQLLNDESMFDDFAL